MKPQNKTALVCDLLVIDLESLVRRCWLQGRNERPSVRNQLSDRRVIFKIRSILDRHNAEFVSLVADARVDLQARASGKIEPSRSIAACILRVSESLSRYYRMPVSFPINGRALDAAAAVVDGFERAQKGKIVMITHDIRYLTLVTPDIRIEDPWTQQQRNTSWILTNCRVPPARVGDWLALTGHPSLGLPTAGNLSRALAAEAVTRYETIENMIGLLREAPSWLQFAFEHDFAVIAHGAAAARPVRGVKVTNRWSRIDRGMLRTPEGRSARSVPAPVVL